MSLSPESRPLLTVNTRMGLYEFQRLPFGVASAPAIFQSFVDELLKGMSNIGWYIDDVIIAGVDIDDCHRKLELVLKRLSEAKVTLKKEKCKFFKDTVTYLGHKVCGHGIYPTESEVRAVKEAPAPTCITELRPI